MRLKRKVLERLLIYTSLIFPVSVLFHITSKEILLVSMLLFLASFILKLKDKSLPRLLINLLGIAFILLFFFTVNLSNFLENALNTLLLLLSIKFIERHTLRDYFQIYLLEFLILCGASFYYAGIAFFGVLLLGFIFFCYALFIHLYLEEGEVLDITLEEFKGIFLTFGALLLSSLLLSSIFFVGLPRLQVPLFNLAVEREKAKTGFTDKIKLGAFSEIQESSAPVLRAVFEEDLKPDPKKLYFRVIAFDHFDGKVWKQTLEEEIPLQHPRYPYSKYPLRKAIIYLLSEQDGYLPVPEGTSFIRAPFMVKKEEGGIFRTLEPLHYPARYEALYADKAESLNEKVNLKRYLQVPEVSPKIKELSQKLKGRTPRETLENILNYFVKEGFTYSLSKLPLGERPLERFLFETKRGNCEYFAGATALLLRLNGIPARVIGGYKGAIFNSKGNYYLVEERFAHAWVEAYLEDRWISLDPTPGFSFEALGRKKGLLEKIRLYYDLINHYYTRLVLDYDYKRQKRFFEGLKEKLSLTKRESLSKEFDFSVFQNQKKAFFLFLALFVVILLLIKYSRVLFEPKEKRLLKRFFRELEKRGYKRERNEGLFEFAERIENQALKEVALKFARIYGEYYYRDIPFDKRGLEELLQCLKELRNLK